MKILQKMSVDIAREIASEHEKLHVSTRQFWPKHAIGIGLAFTVLVSTAAFSTHLFMVETGDYGNPTYSETDASQWLDICAKDLPHHMEQLPQP